MTEEDENKEQRLERYRKWAQLPWGGHRGCKKCGTQAYCHGRFYESQICLECFLKPPPTKRKRKK